MARTAGNRAALFVSTLSLLIASKALTLILELQLPPSLAKAGHWQFLTNLSLMISIMVFLVGTLAHLTHSTTLFTYKNYLHAMGLALETVVAGVYWPLRLFFIPLILPNLEARIPISLDLAIHLLPVISLSIDYYFFMPQWPISSKQAYPLFIVLTLGYWGLLHCLMDDTSVFPYPFLQVPDGTRAFIFALVLHIGFVSFTAQRKIHGHFIGDEVVDKKLVKTE